MPERAPLIVFSDDWGRHPSSCQHLIAQLLPRRRVVWVNTIGTRPPRLNWSTVKRGLEKLRQWSRRGVQDAAVTSGPEVLNPKMWPSFRSRFGRWLNRRWLAKAVRPIAEAMPAPPIVVTTVPLLADLVGAFPAARWVYYCVDDFGVWPGLDGRTLRTMEEQLVAKVDTVIAVSETLQTHLAKLGRASHLLTHGVDLEHFRPKEEAATAQKNVLFWGVIDRRMDLVFVRQLAEQMTEGEIVFVGPQDDPDAELQRLPRVRILPPAPYSELPKLAAESKVLVMPYADLPVTRAMQPLKLKEYLATGKPVVVRELPATESWADCCDVCDSPEQFAAAVIERLRTGLPDSQRIARLRLESETWAAKAEHFERMIASRSAAPRG